MRSHIRGMAGIGAGCLVAALVSGCSSSPEESDTKITATTRTNNCTHYVGDNLSWKQFTDEYRVQDLAWLSKGLSELGSSTLTAAEYNEQAMTDLELVQEKSGESVHNIFKSAPAGSMSAVTLQFCENFEPYTETKRMMSDGMRDGLKRTKEKASISPAVSLRNALWYCTLAAEGKETGKPFDTDEIDYRLVCPQYS